MSSSAETDVYLSSDGSYGEPHSPKKRKRSDGPSRPNHELKKSRYGFNPDYLDVLNNDIVAINSRAVDYYGTYDDGQIGCSFWTKQEKARFFLALDRLGRDNTRGIAQAVKHKSEVEVETYIRLLQDESTEQLRRGEHREQAGILDMEAAVEISPELERELDAAGRSLASRQFAYEQFIQQKRYGQFWRIDERVYLPDLIEEQSHGKTEHFPEAIDLESLGQASNLMRVDMMLALSRYLFMNSREPEGNYRTYAEQDEIPSIQLTALLDLHRLVVTLTKRLAATAHFMALSRLKAGGRGPRSRNLKNHVKSKDVEAAFDTLGVAKGNKGGDYWLRAVRRCKVAVHDSKRSTEYKLGEEIPDRLLEEHILGAIYAYPVDRGARSTTEAPAETEHSISGSATESHAESQTDQDEYDEVETGSETQGDKTIRRHQPRRPGKWMLEARTAGGRSLDDFDTAQEDYVEAKDRGDTAVHEAHLWRMIREDDVDNDKSHTVDLPKRPTDSTTGRRYAIPWRASVGYQSEWERFQEPVAEQDFATMTAVKARCKRRKVSPDPQKQGDIVDNMQRDQALEPMERRSRDTDESGVEEIDSADEDSL